MDSEKIITAKTKFLAIKMDMNKVYNRDRITLYTKIVAEDGFLL